MINDFLVQALKDRNELKISLDGYFMKSELELALHLAKKESQKLKPGFKVFMDIKKLQSAHKELKLDFERLNRIIKSMGGSSLKLVGLEYAVSRKNMQNVGFYPYENAWFL